MKFTCLLQPIRSRTPSVVSRVLHFLCFFPLLSFPSFTNDYNIFTLSESNTRLWKEFMCLLRSHSTTVADSFPFPLFSLLVYSSSQNFIFSGWLLPSMHAKYPERELLSSAFIFFHTRFFCPYLWLESRWWHNFYCTTRVCRLQTSILVELTLLQRYLTRHSHSLHIPSPKFV